MSSSTRSRSASLSLCDERHERHLDDVHKSSCQSDQKHLCDFGHTDRHALPELRADPDGALLCAVHRDLHGHLPQVFTPRLPQGEGRHHRHQHLPLRESLRHQSHPDFWPRGREDGGVPREKPAPRPREPGGDLCVRRVSSSGLHAVYLLDPVSFLSRRHGASERRDVSGPDHHGRHHRHVSTCTFPNSSRPSRIWPSSSIGCSRRWPRRRRCSPSWTLRPKWWMPPTPSSWTR